MVQPKEEPQILTSKEVASYLRVSKRMVQLMAVDGTIPAFRVGRYWRFRREAIEQLTQVDLHEGNQPEPDQAREPDAPREQRPYKPADKYEELLGPAFAPKDRCR